MKNKYADIITKYYENYDEDARISKNRAKQLEYITKMHYIHKFAKKRARILELGASTGAYSIPLAKEGYRVTAFELVQKNLDILIKKAGEIPNLTTKQGDALDLDAFADNSFDVVLSLGPMYHLFDKKDQMQAIREAVRVCKPNGILIFAYITCSNIVLYNGVEKNAMASVAKRLDKNGRLSAVPQDVFVGYLPEDFEKQFEKTNTTKLLSVAADGIAERIENKLAKLSANDFETFVKWHLSTCEHPDHQGLSAHNLYICKKIK